MINGAYCQESVASFAASVPFPGPKRLQLNSKLKETNGFLFFQINLFTIKRTCKSKYEQKYF